MPSLPPPPSPLLLLSLSIFLTQFYMYYMAPYCSLLLIARTALQHPSVIDSKLPTAAWWRLRLYHAHNSCLTGPSSNFLDKIEECSATAAADILLSQYASPQHLHARLLLETSVAVGPFKVRVSF